MARYTQIQTTYDTSLYNEGVLLKPDGSVETKAVNEDGTQGGSQVLSEPGKGNITIKQTVNGSTSTVTFNADQKDDIEVNLPNINIPSIPTIPYYSMYREFVGSRTGSGSINVTLTHTPVGPPLFLWALTSGGTANQSTVHFPSFQSGTGKNYSVERDFDTGVADCWAYYMYRTK